MKYCKHCGKALDEQANFCPYCMQRQQDPVPAPKIQSKKRNLFFLIGIPAVLLLIGGSLTAWWLWPKEPAPQKEPSPEQETVQTPQEPSAPTLDTTASAYDLNALYDNILGSDFEEIKDAFGPEVSPVSVDPFTEFEVHVFNGIELSVWPQTGRIYSYTVDFNLSDPPHRYNYRGIDSSTTYQQVIGLLGMPSDDSGYPYEITYALEKGYLKIGFDEKTKVSRLFALFPFE